MLVTQIKKRIEVIREYIWNVRCQRWDEKLIKVVWRV